jgi:hypothetical protein
VNFPFPAGELRASGRRWPFPCQIPARDTGAIASAPFAPMPRLERPAAGALSITPFCIRMPFGAPVWPSK